MMTKKTFYDLPPKYSTLKKSKVVLVPFGLEKTVSYGKGADIGPRAIWQSSHQVELWDEEIWGDISKMGICSLNFFKIKKGHTEALKQLEKIIDEIFDLKKLPVILGGEHSITLAPIRATQKYFKNFTILQFDAHSDTRDQWLGTKLSHAAVMRRCLEVNKGVNLVQIGIRNVAEEELAFRKTEQRRIKTFWAKDKDDWKINEVLKNCQSHVYLTFDVDVFDSSLIPSTGTPEPGGLGWYKTLTILKAISKNRKIIGADFVELAPIKNFTAPDFLVAKLIYKFLGYCFCNIDKK